MNDTRGTLPERMEAFIRTVDAASTLEEIMEALAGRVPALGFDRFAYWLLWPPEGARQPLCITNYPGDWAAHYLEKNHASHDYVGRFAARSTIPFVWHRIVETHGLTERQKSIFDEARDAGLRAGATVPIHGPGAAKAAFSVAGDMEDAAFEKLFTRQRHEVHLMATYVHEKIIGLGLHKPIDNGIHLTPREIEVLTWTAKGKTRWETSIILNIAEDTVRAHLENVRKKMGASNTTHAIAIALLHGMLLP